MSPPFVAGLHELISPPSWQAEVDPRASLPAYADVAWADQHFDEHRMLTTSYQDYHVWRRDDFAGETINVADGMRRTVGAAEDLESFRFFGGSTTWGWGVDDARTYPSLFVKRTGRPAVNFGEDGYVARQSLAYLQSLYVDSREEWAGPGVVVFYEGVNDVLVRCRTEVDGLESELQRKIQRLVSASARPFSFSRTFGQLGDLLRKATGDALAPPVDHEALFDCEDAPERAAYVASTLVGVWAQAHRTARANGDRFIAVLQPVAFIGRPILDGVSLDDPFNRELAEQYRAVYPLVEAMARARDIPFLSLTDVYDGCRDCYYDFCHVGPAAHEDLVSALVREFEVRGLLDPRPDAPAEAARGRPEQGPATVDRRAAQSG